MEKHEEYATKLISHIQEIFNEDCDNHISPEEFTENDNGTAFIHALANVMPNVIYQRLTGDDVDNLGFNHIANRIAFQFSSPEKKES